MYTVIFNGTINTFQTVEMWNLAIGSIVFDNKGAIVEKCLFSKTAMVYLKQ